MRRMFITTVLPFTLHAAACHDGRSSDHDDSPAVDEAESDVEPRATPTRSAVDGSERVAAAERPADVPSDWKPVSADAWSFWVPRTWSTEPFFPEDGSGPGREGDMSARAPTGTTSCVLRTDLSLPTDEAALKRESRARARKLADPPEVKTRELTVTLDEGEQRVFEHAYAMTRDDAHVVERWIAGSPSLLLSCSDTTPDKDATIATILGSLRWRVGC